jgi:pyruvate/2-oxoglutarate dehydrogenase complex dihydrolipoamide dehydrogenase (E3) component
MKYDYHIIVLGAGSAGLFIAAGASALGAKVALIEADKMGGDCLNTGCVPSKAFKKCARLAKGIQNTKEFGIEASITKTDINKVMNRVKSVIKSIEPHDSKEHCEKLGVDVILRKGQFIDKNSIKVNDKIITANSIVIATGSEPYIPNIKGLNDVQYFTNKDIFDIKKLPSHLIVLGGGAIGLELGQGFRFLGSKVTIIDILPHIFSRDDLDVAPLIEKRLRNDGIDLILDTKIIEVKSNGSDIIVVIEKNGKLEELSGDSLLVAVGRSPVTDGLGLDKVGIKTKKNGNIKTNLKMQTSIKNIYACGDVTEPYHFTHVAGYQASIALKNIIFKLGAKADYSVLPWTTYTSPEVAHVGYTEQQAKSLNIYKDSITSDLADNDRAIINEDTEGFAKLVIGKNGRIIGSTVVGENAGEMIPVITLAIKKKLTPVALLGILFSYPTEAEVFLYASLKKLNSSLKPWHKKLIKSIFIG